MWDLVPWLGIEPIPLALEVWSLNYWTTREIPIGNFRYTKDDDIVVSWIQFSSVQLLRHVLLFVTPMDCSTPGFPVQNQHPEPTQTHVHHVGDAIQPSLPLSSPSPPAFNLSQHCSESVLHIRWPKYWSFSFSISPSNGSSGLISFRMDWLYLLAVQGTVKSLLQHHSSKASILQHSALVELVHAKWTMKGRDRTPPGSYLVPIRNPGINQGLINKNSMGILYLKTAYWAILNWKYNQIRKNFNLLLFVLLVGFNICGKFWVLYSKRTFWLIKSEGNMKQ